MVCGFSGHRPQRLPWGFDEGDLRCLALKLRIRQEIALLAEQGVAVFLCGMAHGCDFYFAEAVLELKQTRGDISLVGALPCPDQDRGWSDENRRRFADLCEQCDKLELLSDAYTPGCMSDRNRWMAERSDYFLTVFDGGGGGTANAVGHARRLGVTVVPLWL